MISDTLDSRRAVLAPSVLPPARVEYVVRMDLECENGNLTLTYVPDRFTVDEAAVAAYLPLVMAMSLSTELKAITILEDLVNELVCRWLRVSLSLEGKSVVVEDRQPGWRNDDLLARLP